MFTYGFRNRIFTLLRIDIQKLQKYYTEEDCLQVDRWADIYGDFLLFDLTQYFF